MDWNAAIEEDNRRMLKRIIGLLFALARLAERLCGLPRPVRAFVLRILGSAEAVARDFLLETTRYHGVPAPRPACFGALQGGDDPADAIRLAQSFRLLAVLLDRLANGNPRRGKRLITLAVRAMLARLLVAMRLERRRLFTAAMRFAVERRDSS